jgi:hypothetical protein
MRLFLATFLEAAHASLQKPDELAGFAGRSRIAYLVPVLCAFSTSVAAYLLRDFYESIFLFNILVTAILQTAAYVIYGLMFAALVDFFVQKEHEDRAGKGHGAFLIFLYCLLPLVFTFPIAAIARVTPVPFVVAGAGSILLHAWCAFGLVRALQYYYEIPLRGMLTAMLKSFAATVGFPLVLLFLASFRLVSSL